MRERGLSGSLIEAAVGSETRDEQLVRARQLLESKGFDVGDPDQRRKALGALARKGFESETSYDALREYASRNRDGGGTG